MMRVLTFTSVSATVTVIETRRFFMYKRARVGRELNQNIPSSYARGRFSFYVRRPLLVLREGCSCQALDTISGLNYLASHSNKSFWIKYVSTHHIHTRKHIYTIDSYFIITFIKHYGGLLSRRPVIKESTTNEISFECTSGLFNNGDKALRNRLVFLRLTRLTRDLRNDSVGPVGISSNHTFERQQSFS